METKEVKNKTLEGKRILIVEDDVFIAKVYEKWIRLYGGEPIMAADGSRGLSILDTQKIDIVLLDLGMPGINGFDMVAQLREKSDLKNLPVVILTNDTVSRNKIGEEILKKAGVKHVLQKYQTSLKELIHCIESYFPSEAH